MANYNNNLTLTEQPETGSWEYYNPVGVAFDDYDIGLDPADTPLVFGFTPLAVGSPANADYFFSIAAAGTIASNAQFTVNGTVFNASTVKTAVTFLDTTTAQLLQALQSLADCIAKDATLGALYSVQVFPSGLFLALRITAKRPGSAFDLTVSLSGFTGTNPPINTAGADTDRAMQLQAFDYGAWCRVYALIGEADRLAQNFPGPILQEDRDKFVEIIQGGLAASWGGQPIFRFDISSFLAPYCVCAVPSTAFSDYEHRPLAIVPYYVRYGERFTGGFLDGGGGPDDYGPANPADDITDTYLADWVTGEGETRFAIGVALPLNEIPAPFIAYWREVQKIGSDNQYFTILPLSSAPQWKLRRRGIFYEVVAFIAWNDYRYSSSLPLRVRTTFTRMDGSTATTSSSAASVTTQGVHLVDVGLGKVQLASVESGGVRVRFFTTVLQAERGTGNWVDVWRQDYELDLNYEPNRYVKLAWRNRFNAFDQFEFECWDVKEANREAETFTRSLPLAPGDSRATAIRAVTRTEAEVNRTLASGWVDATHMEYLRELLRAPEVWTVEVLPPLENVYTAVEVLESEWSVDSYGQLYRLTLTYRLSHPENNKAA